MSAEQDFFSIVVLGAMNPRIHHPTWYRLVGLISEQEEQQALESGLLVTPPVAQFQCPGFVVLCQEERWEVQTNRSELFVRLRDLTSRVFDELLNHTPLNRYGFNFDYVRSTEAPDVAKLLAQAIVSLPLGLRAGNAAAGEIVLRRYEDDHTIAVTLRPFESTAVKVASNFDYTTPGTKGFFNLRDRIESRHPIDHAEAVEQTAEIVSAINHMAGK